VSTYDDLAALFTYPDATGLPRVRAAAAALEGLGPFAARIRAGAPERHEEHFTRTFDINPVASLEVGWHLYGEDYSRGAFLVRMRALMRDCEVPEIRELPDHLTNVLAVIGRLGKAAADELARGYALPAVAKMLHGFEKKENDYRGPLEAVQRFLRARHGRESEPGEIQAQPYGGACAPCASLPGEEVRGE
jgi:nitrate reductase assembly molybdenum cofactor insertion protein NarJ